MAKFGSLDNQVMPRDYCCEACKYAFKSSGTFALKFRRSFVAVVGLLVTLNRINSLIITRQKSNFMEFKDANKTLNN